MSRTLTEELNARLNPGLETSPNTKVQSHTRPPKDVCLTAEFEDKKMTACKELQAKLDEVDNNSKKVPSDSAEAKKLGIKKHQLLMDLESWSLRSSQLELSKCQQRQSNKVGLYENDHLYKILDPKLSWVNRRCDGHVSNALGAATTYDPVDREQRDQRNDRDRRNARGYQPLHHKTAKFSSRFADKLLVKNLNQGIRNLKEQGFDLTGWTKDLSVICHGVDNPSLKATFDEAAGWDDDLLDCYDLGISCCAPQTNRNKVSLLRAFLLFCYELEKSPPYSLQDIYSFLLRVIESGKRISNVQFNAISAALLPIGLIIETPAFSVLRSELGRMIKQAGNKQDVKKCEPWDGRCNLPQLHACQPKLFMLAVWALSGARFSTISQLRASHVQRVKVKGESVIALTFWYDKIFQRQGRHVILSCNCSPAFPGNLNLCAVCAQVSDADLNAYLTLSSWKAFQKELQVQMHVFRRWIAIEIAKYNLRSSSVNKIAKERINVYLGWATGSNMIMEYSHDLHKYKDKVCPILIPSLIHNINLTYFVETADWEKNKDIKNFRQAIISSSFALVEQIKDDEFLLDAVWEA
jgi:hypothetical protein